mmetsp:Transcript_53701/g.114055  ORF Transcript_53701/g.114055 Transcript_53701/m.114055 type:complete len:228 (+) Transcript_53701:321-1004(+)
MPLLSIPFLPFFSPLLVFFIKFFINATNTGQHQQCIHALRHLHLIVIHHVQLHPTIHIGHGHSLTLLILESEVSIEEIPLDTIGRIRLKQPRDPKPPLPLHVNIECVHETDQLLLHPTNFRPIASVKVVRGSCSDKNSIHDDQLFSRRGGRYAHFVLPGQMEHCAPNPDEIFLVRRRDINDVKVFPSERNWSLLDGERPHVARNRQLRRERRIVRQVCLRLQRGTAQ